MGRSKNGARKRTRKPAERKKRTQTHVDGDRALNVLESVALDCGFALERSGAIDYGTDFTLHVFDDDGHYVGFALGQSRARSGLEPNQDGSISLSVDIGHIHQWLDLPIPFVLILFDIKSKAGYWYYIQAHRAELEKKIAAGGETQQEINLRFESSHVIGVEALERFRSWVVRLQQQAAEVLEFSEDA